MKIRFSLACLALGLATVVGACNVDTTSAIEVPDDCSCYNPLADDDEMSCLDVEDVLPGCQLETSSCGAVSDGFEDASIEAMECLLGQLAAGERPSFDSSFDDGGQEWGSSHWVHLGNGRYARQSCRGFNGGGSSNSVATEQAAGDAAFQACLEQLQADGDGQAAYWCLVDGFEDSTDPYPVCM